MGFLSLEPDQSNTKDTLVLTDHFTKYAVAITNSKSKGTDCGKVFMGKLSGALRFSGEASE